MKTVPARQGTEVVTDLAVASRPRVQRGSWRIRYVTALVVADGAAGTAAGLLAQLVRFDSLDGSARQPQTTVPHLGLTLLLSLVWVGSLALGGVYGRRRMGT